MDELRASADVAVARLAARQHGVVTSAQLAQAGLSKDAVWKRTRAGRLHRAFRGVYAVGHKGLGNEGRWMAAVLACGEGAVLSHRSAAEFWQLLRARDGPVDVTIPTTAGRRKRPGLRIHRTPSLPSNATTIHNRIAVTTPARTITDLKRAVPTHELRKATRQAEFPGLPLEIETDRTRSDLERDFLRLCRRHRLPPPEVNARISALTVDFLWREQRLIVETDGYAAHRGRQAFEDDHARELYLHSRGYRVHRFTAHQVAHRQQAVAAAVRRGLGR